MSRHMPTLSGPVALELTRHIISVRDYGAVGDGVTDDTAAIQAAIDAAHELGTGYIVYFPATDNEYMFSNLKLWAYTILHGSRMAQCQLRRLPGSTGNAITEYAAADGNSLGARTIWIQDLGVHGNGTTGNGIDLGYINASRVFETWATLRNVFVQGFTSGIGMHLAANAISLEYVYALGNQDGIHVTGSYCKFHSVFCEVNTRYQLRCNGTGHTFFGVHCEVDTSTDPAILIEGNAQAFYGISIYFSVNIPHVIEIATGATKTQIHDVHFAPAGATTFTHGIYCTDASNGRTGTDRYIQHYQLGELANVASWYVNTETNKVDKKIADTRTSTGHDVITDLTVGNAELPLITGLVKITDSDTDTQLMLECTGSDGRTYIVGASGAGASVPKSFYVYDSTASATAIRLDSDGMLTAYKALALPGEIAPAQLTGNVDNYNPTGLAGAVFLYLTSDASRDITGFVGGAAGRRLWLYNGGAQNIVLKHKVTSTAANQICGRVNADTTLTPGTGCELVYSVVAGNFWLVTTDTL